LTKFAYNPLKGTDQRGTHADKLWAILGDLATAGNSLDSQNFKAQTFTTRKVKPDIQSFDGPGSTVDVSLNAGSPTVVPGYSLTFPSSAVPSKAFIMGSPVVSLDAGTNVSGSCTVNLRLNGVNTGVQNYVSFGPRQDAQAQSLIRLAATIPIIAVVALVTGQSNVVDLTAVATSVSPTTPVRIGPLSSGGAMWGIRVAA